MRPVSVRNTPEEPDTVRTDSATDARPDPWPGSAPLSRWRTNGFAARFSAALRAGRSSCRSKVRAAWAMEIAPTATSTAQHDEGLQQEELPGQRHAVSGGGAGRHTKRIALVGADVTVTTMTTTCTATAMVTATHRRR